MAKKLVKYAFGTPQRYNNIVKKDDYTVYFVYDTVIDEITGKEVPGKYGTIYKGNTRIGSACASDIVFDKELDVVILDGGTPEDSVIVKIEPGMSLTEYAEMALRHSATLVEGLRSEFLGDGTGNDGVIYDILSQESEFDSDGHGLGIISEAINTGIANSIDVNGTVTSFLEENYVSKDNLGRIEELANILDQDTLDTLITAASDIQGVLNNYYDKEDTSTLFREVIVADTSAGFPEIGDENKLYISKDDNYMYRWTLSSIDSEDVWLYTLVTGGGDAANVEVKTNLYIKDNAISVSIAKDTSYTVEYAFSSANTYTQYHPVHGFSEVKEQIGAIGNAAFYLDGALIGSSTCTAANYYDNPEEAYKNIYATFTIPAARFTGSTHVLTIRVKDVASHEAEASITINVVNVSITSSFVANPTSLNNSLEVPVTVASSNPVAVWYKLDDGEPVLYDTISGVTRETITIAISPYADETNTVKRTHGLHNIDIWATATIAETGDVLTSSHLTWEFIWFDPQNNTPIVSFVCLDETNLEGEYEVSQYEYSSFKYQVYPRSNIRLMCNKHADPSDPLSENVLTEVLSMTNVSTVAHNWTYIFNEAGVYDMYALISNDNTLEEVQSDAFVINVNESQYAMNPVNGATLYMTAQNHNNAGEHAWHSTIHNDRATGAPLAPLSADLTNFAWNENSGWYTDPTDHITTALRVGAGARCEIPFTPFRYNYSSTGMTFEVDFSTSRLANSEATVIDCYSGQDKIGITITATGAYWETGDNKKVSADGDGRMHVPFREGERVRLSFVMTPANSDDAGSADHTVSFWQGEGGSGSYQNVETVSSGYWRFLKIYVNGICSSITKYKSEGGGIQQSNPSKIVIGSDSATVDIYNLRVYSKVLYDKDIVDNYIADTQDPSKKLSLFLRNNILNDAGTEIDAVRLSHMLPCLYVTCESSSVADGFKNDEHILPMNKKDKRGYTVIYDCENLDPEYKEKFSWAKSFIAFNAQMTVQGTSSQYYPRKNYKLTFKPIKLSSGESLTAQKFISKVTDSSCDKPTVLYTGTKGNAYIAESGMTGIEYATSHIEVPEINGNFAKKYKLRDFTSDVEKSDLDHISSIKATKFCLKADFMESSSTHNTGLAKYTDYLLKRNGEKYLTPPQLSQYRASNKTTDKITDIDIRTTIDGYPCAIFWRERYTDTYTFLGKYNFNFDKGAEEVFGFIGDDVEELINPWTGHEFSVFNEDYYDAIKNPLERKEYESPVECWEFTNNTTDLCKFKNVTSTSFTDTTTVHEAGGEKQVPDWIESFEARHPDNDNLVDDIEKGTWVPTHFADFCKWVSDTNPKGYFDTGVNKYPIATAWNGTVEELEAGARSNTAYVIIDKTYEELIALHETGDDTQYILLDENTNSYRIGLLEPKGIARVTVVDGNEEIEFLSETELAALTQEDLEAKLESEELKLVNKVNYEKFGYTVVYDPITETWGEATPLVQETFTVDKTKTYYINKENDINFNKVYQYVIVNAALNEGEWQNVNDATLESSYTLSTPAVYGTTTYLYDTAEYRLAKFRNELNDHMNVDFVIAYYIISEFFCASDQRAKNMMFATWGYEPLRVNKSVKDASEYESVEAADEAGYKPVYSYDAVPVSEEDATLTTEKEVLYYVPKDCHYIYYPIFYDNDTILGVNNSGYLVFNPDIESTDTLKTGNAFNGGDSVLWLNLKDAFASEIAATYASMRKNGLTYQDAMKFFTNTQSDAWSESIYNMDAKFKYIEPATIGYINFATPDDTGKYGVNAHNDYYLFECQGSRATHRSWWLANRFTYMDSRYDCGDYHDSFAVFRIYTNLAEGTYDYRYQPDSTFFLTPYTDMYLRVKFGTRTPAVRAKKNVQYAISTGTNDKYNDTETMVYGASNILSYGNLTLKYVKNCDVGPSSKITEFKLGEASPYYNDNVENVSFNPANTALKTVDVRNCRSLSTLNGLELIPSIETFLGSGTALSRVDFDANGSNAKFISYPSSITAVKLINMPFITSNNILFESKEHVSSIWIEGCNNLKGGDSLALVFQILNESQTLANIRLVDIDWNIETFQEFERWTRLLKLHGMNEQGSSEYDVPYISGIIRIGNNISISNGYREGLAQYIADNAGGAQLTILGGTETDLQDISISVKNTATDKELDINNFKMTIGVDYTFFINYLPDNFISTKGVTWSYSDSHVQEINRTAESITLRYTGSTAGTTAFTLTATSIYNTSKFVTAIVYPNPTLSAITLSIGGQVYQNGSTYSLYEGDRLTIDVGFDPIDSPDKDVVLTITNQQYFEPVSEGVYYEYSSSTKQIYLTAGSVSNLSNAAIVVTSRDVPEVSSTLNISILNKVSRIIHLLDATNGAANAHHISGNIRVRVLDDPQYENQTFIVNSGVNGSNLGIITLPANEFDLSDPTNPKFGGRKLAVTGYANDRITKKYNQPVEMIIPAITETAEIDNVQNIYFYEPVQCTVTLRNGGKVIDDPNIFFNFRSLLHNTLNYPGLQNNITIHAGNNPASINMIAASEHNIEVYQVESQGTVQELTSNVTYNKHTGKINIGSSSQNIDINLSRDYLSTVDPVKESELHMVVVTGRNNYRTLRLYVNISGPIVINWGDGSTLQLAPGGEGTYIQTETDTSAVITAKREFVVYHEYQDPETEYEIYVQSSGASSDVGNINWLHVISAKDKQMKACFATAATSSFAWSGDEAEGGLVGYLCAGTAVLRASINLEVQSTDPKYAISYPRFNFSDTEKKYSKLICVGDIYKNLGDNFIDASEIFTNSTIEQLPYSPIFSENHKIKSFKKCFKNTNITRLADNFFENNPEAINFEETFKNCKYLFAIGANETSKFINVEDRAEIESLGGMFSGCSELTGYAPRLWERYYGDCFLDCSTNQGNTSHSVEGPFVGCNKLLNYSDIPVLWGGENYTWNPGNADIELSYIEPITGGNLNIRTAPSPAHAGVRIDLGDIEISNKDSFELIITPIGRYGDDPSAGFTAHEPAFIFGAATYDEDAPNQQTPQQEALGDYKNITNVIDFSWNGGPGSNTTGYTGVIGYRNGDADIIDLSRSDDGSGSAGEDTFPGPMVSPIDRGWNNRYRPGFAKYQPVKIEICRNTERNNVVVKKLNLDLSEIPGNQSVGYLNHYVDINAPEVISNTPLRLFSSYMVKINQITQFDDTDYNFSWTNSHINYRFHELKIYDGNNNLKHWLVPRYGKTEGSVESNWRPHVYDIVRGGRYTFTGGKNNITAQVRYYRKDHNLLQS